MCCIQACLDAAGEMPMARDDLVRVAYGSLVL
jgi:hypothetical protein